MLTLQPNPQFKSAIHHNQSPAAAIIVPARLSPAATAITSEFLSFADSRACAAWKEADSHTSAAWGKAHLPHQSCKSTKTPIPAVNLQQQHRDPLGSSLPHPRLATSAHQTWARSLVQQTVQQLERSLRRVCWQLLERSLRQECRQLERSLR